MKTFKKLFTILAIVLVAIMAFVPAKSLATDNDLTITVTGDVGGRTLSVYKLFNLTVTEETVTENGTTKKIPVYNYTWANGSEAFFTSIGKDSIAKATDYLRGLTTTELTKLAEDFYKYCNTNGIAAAVSSKKVADAATSVDFTVKGEGYYLIYDETKASDLNEGSAISVGILQNVTDGSIVPNNDNTFDIKAESVEVTKAVNEPTGFVGETKYFTINTEVPNLSGYDSYTFTVIDTMSKGLTFEKKINNADNVQVKIDGVVYPETVGEGENAITQYTVTSSKDSETGKTTLTIAFTPAEFVKLTKGKKIVITYSAVLNSEAATEVINENEVKIEYSNDPKSCGTGITPPDIVHVYTYKIDFKKINTAGTGLQGAEFVLMSGNNYVNFDEDGKYIEVESRDNAKIFSSNSDGIFTIAGLKAGTYKLVETKAPVIGNDKYHLPNFGFTFTITQDENDPSKATFTYTPVDDNAKGYLTAEVGFDSTTKTFAVDVLNSKEGELPTTGGIGTTIFTVIGIAVMAVAVVALVARNRKND